MKNNKTLDKGLDKVLSTFLGRHPLPSIVEVSNAVKNYIYSNPNHPLFLEVFDVDVNYELAIKRLIRSGEQEEADKLLVAQKEAIENGLMNVTFYKPTTLDMTYKAIGVKNERRNRA